MGLIAEDLEASYQQHHPDKIKLSYRLVQDIGDFKTQELTLDQVWAFEKKSHLPKEQADQAIKTFCKKMRVFVITAANNSYISFLRHDLHLDGHV